MTGYLDWESFIFKGKRFLAMFRTDGNVYIRGVGFSNYGAWFCVDNFKKEYAARGEELRLDVAESR